jgi:hypothetical protein
MPALRRLVDCDDLDCMAMPDYTGNVEICHNERDDDGDDQFDCGDADCADDPEC